MSDESETCAVSERSLWLGSSEHPIFARLTTPAAGSISGGLLISPPIGREARAARQTLRTLAISLAADGFAVLRYDHFGTGDSSGDFDDDTFFVEWTDQIARGLEFVRFLGAPSVSALGMRLGATILGRAAQLHALSLSSIVLWDPCESGRSYLRERAAFEAVTQDLERPGSAQANEKSEFVYRDATKEKMRTLTLLETDPASLGERILIITRDDRVTPAKLTRQFDTDIVQWESTNEQRALMEVELPAAKLPHLALGRIRQWIVESNVDVNDASLRALPEVTTSPVGTGPGQMKVREQARAIGPRGQFAIVSEPESGAVGPWIVMINGANEDHVGPSRLWVDLSRRWSSFGLRCVRFDFVGLGESPGLNSETPAKAFDDTDVTEIYDVIRSLSPDDPTNAVLIGLCSGAHRALQAALQLNVRGVCTINPQVGPASLRNPVPPGKLEGHSIRSRVRTSIEAQPWIGRLVRQMCRVLLPSAYSFRVRKMLAKKGTEMLIITSPQDINPFPRVPILRSLDKPRLISTRSCQIEVVPGMDHDLLNSEGRAKAVEILDNYIMKIFSS